MKRLLMMIGAAAVAVGANADTYKDKDDIEWTFTASGSNATLGNGTDPCIATSTSVDAANIPWTFTKDGVNYTVTALAAGAFQNCIGLTGTLSIPDTVTSMSGNNTFNGCTGITAISSFGNGQTVNMGQSTFRNCSGLTGVLVVPDSFNRVFGNFAFDNCDGLTGVIVGNGTTQVPRYFASNCDKLKGLYVKGRSGNNFTTVFQPYACYNSTSLKVVLYGWNTSLSQNSAPAAAMFGNVSGCKVFVPANGKWETVYFGGTNTDPIYYGANTNLNIAVDEANNAITFTPTDERALVKSLEAAPLFKDAFGWNAKINITNTIEVAEGAITSEMLNAVEFNTLLLTFAVKTQAQLDDILKKFPASTYPMLAIDVKPSGSGKTEALTLPNDRELWVHLPGDGKFTPKYNGLIISFH